MESINYRLAELHLFGSFECSSTYDSYIDGGSDLFLPSMFLRNKEIMVASSVVSKEASDIGPLYTTEENIILFWKQMFVVKFSKQALVSYRRLIVGLTR